ANVVDDVTVDEGDSGGGTTCSEENPTPSGGFVNAFTSSSNQQQRMATDLTVPADTDFNFERIVTNFWRSPGTSFSNCEVRIYSNAGGFPGTLLDTQNIVPGNQTVIGTASGFDVVSFELDIDPILLAGQPVVSTTYWVGLTITTANNTSAYWDATNTILNLQSVFSPDGGTTWNINSGWDQV